MKRILSVLSLIAVSFPALPLSAAEDSGRISNFRESLKKAGFISYRSDRFNYGFSAKGNYVYLALLGNAALKTNQVVFRADRLLFVYYLSGESLPTTHPFIIYAEDNVVVGPGPKYKYGPKPFLTADGLYYDGRLLEGLAVNAELRLKNIKSLKEKNLPVSLSLLTKELRFKGKLKKVKKTAEEAEVRFHYFSAEDISISNCDFSPQHWGLKCASAEAKEEKHHPGEYSIHTHGQYLAIADHSVLPLPPVNISTRYFQTVPLRRIRICTSDRFGPGVRTTWDAGKIPGTAALVNGFEDLTGVPLEADLQLDGFSKRGVGVGTELRYGNDPNEWKGASWRNVKGEMRLYGIHDTGEDRNEDELYGGRGGDAWRKDDRYRLRLFHRMDTPSYGSLNAEVALWRDRNFYKEFFEGEYYHHRTPETYVLWKREFYDTAVTSVLFRPRVNPFLDRAERLPEGKIRLLPLRLSDSAGPTVKGELRAANMRYQPDELSADKDSFRTGRYHGEATVALPVGLGRYIRFRPFYSVKGTSYERRWQQHGGAERLVESAGATASTHIWRNFPLDSSWLGISGLRHVIVPTVSYSHAFYCNHENEEFFHFDDIDLLDKLEYLELAVATYLLGRKSNAAPGEETVIERLLELRARVKYYPRAGRDHIHGTGTKTKAMNWSNVHLDLFSDLLHRNVRIGVEGEIDTERGKGFSALDPYISVRIPDKLALTLGELFITGDSYLGRKESNYFWANCNWYLSDTYTLSGYFRYDFTRDKADEQYLGISRRFHCVTVQAGVEIDEGDDDVKWTLHLYPTGYDYDSRH